MKRLSVFLGRPQYEALQHLAAYEGTTISELIRRAIAHFLHAHKE